MQRQKNKADIAYNNADMDNILLRPYLLLKGPATNIATVAVKVRELTAHPNSILVSSNSISKNFTTPEITEASKPIRKPPKATISEINTTCNLALKTYKIYCVKQFQ